MHNDRDDKYEGSDDSEYQFSDDEGLDTTESDSTVKAEPDDGGHGGILETVTRSKRMIFSFIAFIVLIAVVYKMVSPAGSSAPSTDITPVAAAPMTAAPPATPVVAQPAAEPPKPTVTPAMQALQPQPAQPLPQQASTSVSPINPQMSAQQAMQPPAQQAMQQATPAASAMQPMSNPPAVIIEAGMPPSMPMQIPAAATGYSTQSADTTNAEIARESAKLVAGMEAQYAKQAAEFQSEMQTINSRVAKIESEIEQLVQTLTQQVQSAIAPGASAAPAAGHPAQTKATPPPRVPYNVQAIIPGRAWLRSNSGDTLTVAEGDEIKGIGRVAKIDPYDGVVEINVRGKMVSLSYGNGS